MAEGITVAIFWLGIFLCYTVEKGLSRVSRNLIALRIDVSGWMDGPVGLKIREIDDSAVEIVSKDGYRYFKTRRAYEKFLRKRPDLK